MVLLILNTLYYLKKEEGLSFKSIYVTVLKLLIPFVILIGVSMLFKCFIPDSLNNRLMSVLYACLYFGVGLLVYFGVTIKQGTFYDILNDLLPNKFKRRVK